MAGGMRAGHRHTWWATESFNSVSLSVFLSLFGGGEGAKSKIEVKHNTQNGSEK